MPTSAMTPLPFKTLATTLRNITEYLARQITHPTDEVPDWTDTGWRISKAVMALQGMSGPLARSLRWRGPEHWEAFLDEQKTHGKLRYENIADTLAQIDLMAKREGVAIVALKGAALYRSDIYRPGERSMGDIDLLVKPRDVIAAKTIIERCGYSEAFTSERHITFEPAATKKPVTFGEHIDNPIKIELHEKIREALPIAAIDITASAFPRQCNPGINHYPSRAALFRHLLLHAATNIRARALRQIQLHDIALLAARMETKDWEELLAPTEKRGLWWALAPLTLTARYYGESIPTSVILAAKSRCPIWLQRVTQRQMLTDVSWSNIRIEAFPGIEWSKSPLEAAAFIKSRVLPTRADLINLKQVKVLQPWTAQIPWYGQSHLKRIARWVFSRPPRVQTLYSVQSALQQTPQSAAPVISEPVTV